MASLRAGPTAQVNRCTTLAANQDRNHEEACSLYPGPSTGVQVPEYKYQCNLKEILCEDNNVCFVGCFCKVVVY